MNTKSITGRIPKDKRQPNFLPRYIRAETMLERVVEYQLMYVYLQQEPRQRERKKQRPRTERWSKAGRRPVIAVEPFARKSIAKHKAFQLSGSSK